MERRPLDVAILSDLHLGTYGAKAKEVLNYLKSIAPQMLILNGDVIDAWQFSKHYFPASHMAVVKEVLCMMAKGTRVIYITGNHDEIMRRYSDIELGNFQLTDKLVIEINSKMTWIFHGDVFDNTTKGAAKFWAKLGSSGYGFLILLNRAINTLMKCIGRERVSLSKSVMAGVNKAVTRINDFEMTAAEIAIEKKYDYVICGHIHQPQKRMVETDLGKVMYLNSGDWVEHMTSLEFYQNDWHIYTYDEKQFENSKVEIEKPILNVVTDEVNFYVQSLAI
ncbi:UDP-2,3-diacylglucosamine diphosphatase [Flavihumibacter sp. CACIAM 22H1]|uniref:UDP-2,3-diacylglucosamine diphosphatase n=1 Tax=Flavihumibacter sp. CACIAM 22H1 TaxID=1812911 RepID=UPI0007A89456|nr:UDP-2,3-diacylglucosamine diphosphatase [Flavihumibacter sp. CACIAM 22H1]KYP14566.1 MAG: UDP-2,3-diacylglucosamine hydrolase [Flavihumibacter sp. CACIAM 22H1]